MEGRKRMKDLVLVQEKTIKGEKQFRLINWLTDEEVKRLVWALDFDEVKIIERGREEKKQR